MRLYFQGTLDYACGVYAVINALSCTHSLELGAARGILQEVFQALPEQPHIWRAFIRNETDHYWLIRRTLSRWCLGPHWEYRAMQPFGDSLMPGPEWMELENISLYLPEREFPRGPVEHEKAVHEADAVWQALQAWFSGQEAASARVALIRFHRFLPGLAQPIVSHWTTISHMQEDVLMLHDASSEKQAVRAIPRADCTPSVFAPALIRIVPESVLLLERPGIRGILHPA